MIFRNLQSAISVLGDSVKGSFGISSDFGRVLKIIDRKKAKSTDFPAISADIDDQDERNFAKAINKISNSKNKEKNGKIFESSEEFLSVNFKKKSQEKQKIEEKNEQKNEIGKIFSEEIEKNLEEVSEKMTKNFCTKKTEEKTEEIKKNTAKNSVKNVENSVKKSVVKFGKSIAKKPENNGQNGGNRHVPIMTKEVLEALRVKDGGCYIDATFGGGGHSRAILENNGIVLGIDRDPRALEHAQVLESEFGAHFEVKNASFAEIESIWEEKINPIKVDGILFDLGFSSNQIEDSERGFSFAKDGPLDMRFDLQDEMTAQKWLNTANSEEIAEVFLAYGQEKNSKIIAKEIVKRRKKTPITTTFELVKIIEEFNKFDSKHAATRIFQAIRIHVNDEFGHIQRALYSARQILRQHGVLAVITFHSLEDKIVKDFFENEVNFLRLPTEEEIQANPRSRSAKLRWMIKTGEI